eukprot:TRINITY_DN631_c0_g1_i10.p1 TRINITY_DN631_c0_g1~~TRINITY_DN631_c0_g1_i10.p1  ORF type:complete len:212 (+),score=-5.41 TRINITY_DN631_c0_g1_i10:414-1049(+)
MQSKNMYSMKIPRECNQQLSKDPNSDKLKLATKKGVQVPNYYETFCFPIWYQLFCKLQQENHFKHCYVNSNILFVIAPKTRFNKYNIDKKKMLFSLQMLLSKQTFQILKMQLNHLNVTKHKMLLCAQTAIRLTCKRAALLHPKNSLQNQMSFFFSAHPLVFFGYPAQNSRHKIQDQNANNFQHYKFIKQNAKKFIFFSINCNRFYLDRYLF